MEPVRGAGCPALQRRLRGLQAANDRLEGIRSSDAQPLKRTRRAWPGWRRPRRSPCSVTTISSAPGLAGRPR